MTKTELIELGNKIILSKGSEAEDELCALFDRNVPHPEGSMLFFFPENYPFRKDDIDIDNYHPTVEEVVDACLAYQPIITPFRKPGS
jgi:hypothetical protein